MIRIDGLAQPPFKSKVTLVIVHTRVILLAQ